MCMLGKSLWKKKSLFHAVLAVQAGAGELLAHLPTKPGRGLTGSPFLSMYHLILNCLGFLMAWSLGSKGRCPQKAKKKLHGFG